MLAIEKCSIRPLELSDKNRILQWRNSERVRSNMYSDHLISQQEHGLWFSRTLDDKSSAFLVFQYEAQPVGCISFTNIDRKHNRCTWAFFLGETSVPKGTGSAMEYFALDYAFWTLKIRKLCCEVFVFNAAVIRLHEKFGFLHEGRLIQHYVKNGVYEDIVCLAKFGDKWNQEREILRVRCFGKSEN